MKKYETWTPHKSIVLFFFLWYNNLKMRNYELVAIISPEVDEDALSKIIGKVNQSINNQGGIEMGEEEVSLPDKEIYGG